MAVGQGSISVNQKKVTTPVPPFPLNAAENGLSVDPITKKIVLGNSVGAVGDPAQLLSNRETKLKGFYLDYIGQAIEQFFDDASGVFQLYRNPAGVLAFNVDATGKTYQLGEDYRIDISQPFETIKLRNNAEPFLNILGAAAARNLTLGIGSPALFLNDLGANKQTILQTDVTVPNAIRFGMEKTGGLAYIKIQNDFYLSVDVGNGLFELGDISKVSLGLNLQLDVLNRVAQVSENVNTDPALYLDYGFGQFAIGDFFGVGNGVMFEAWEANNVAQSAVKIGVNSSRPWLRAQGTIGLFELGDMNVAANGTNFQVDDVNGFFSMKNTANTAFVKINGVNGFTGTVAPVNTITVNGGIVTNVA